MRHLSSFAVAPILMIALFIAPHRTHAIAVSATAPGGNANNVARNASIVIDFDLPVATASITPSSLRIWGPQSGRVAGAIAYSNGNRTLTFTPSGTYFPVNGSRCSCRRRSSVPMPRRCAPRDSCSSSSRAPLRAR